MGGEVDSRPVNVSPRPGEPATLELELEVVEVRTGDDEEEEEEALEALPARGGTPRGGTPPRVATPPPRISTRTSTPDDDVLGP